MASFPPVYNNVATLLRSPHTVGDGVIKVEDGTGFGTTFPIRITCQRASDSAIVIFQVTARTGNDLTITGSIEGTADISLSAGDLCQQRLTALAVTEMQQALLYSTTTPVTSTTGGINPGTTFSNSLTKNVVDLILHSPTNTALATGGEAHGNNAVALGQSAFALGESVTATGDYCVAEGIYSSAGMNPLNCIINDTVVTIQLGDYTRFFNTGNLDLALSSLSGGTGPKVALATIANITYNGTDTVLTLAATVTNATNGRASSRSYITAAHAEGGATAAGNNSHAEGGNATANGDYSHAESRADAEGESSHAENESYASGYAAHSENQSYAYGDNSHSEGGGTTSAGANMAHAEGYSTAGQPYTHAGGYNANADHLCQFARSDGGFTINSAPVRGQYCTVSMSLETLNNGTGVLMISGGLSGQHGALTVPDGNSFSFEARVFGKAASGTHASFARQGIIQTRGGVTSLVGAVTTIGTDNNANAWTVNITADNITHQLSIQVQGGLGEGTTCWIARVDWLEIGAVV